MVGPPPRTVLDIGCGQGELGHSLKKRGHRVVGIDYDEPKFELDEFVRADLSQGLPLDGRRFDVVLLADVLEHMLDPKRLLLQAKEKLAAGGKVLVSLPNVTHWSVRAQIAMGKFDYTNKGILERGHVRFFTRASAERLFADAGLRTISRRTTPVPWENVIPPALGRYVTDKVEKADYLFTRLGPNLFAYQHLFELAPTDVT
jgi:2-polyprenyl-3-methyl-5-hydroxy-6-metoxy-1,4-benzoquinol methylase